MTIYKFFHEVEDQKSAEKAIADIASHMPDGGIIRIQFSEAHYSNGTTGMRAAIQQIADKSQAQKGDRIIRVQKGGKYDKRQINGIF